VEPMKPMQPMKPMEPMKPMDFGPAWWPDDLGQPNSSGGQNGVRYAFFADAHRLVIDSDGTVSVYDSGDHRINGVSQQQGGASSLVFSSQRGDVKLDTLKKIS
jgi:hypothetical protein